MFCFLGKFFMLELLGKWIITTYNPYVINREKPFKEKKEIFADGFKSSVQYRILSPNSQRYESWDRFTNILSQSLFQYGKINCIANNNSSYKWRVTSILFLILINIGSWCPLGSTLGFNETS